MTDFESTLASALRAEAEEIAMTIDHDRAADVLETRLDQADRSRRRTYWVAAAAVVAVIAGAAVLAGNLGDNNAEAPPVGPSPSTSAGPAGYDYTSNSFQYPLSVTLPPWFTSPEYPENVWVTQLVWEQSTCSVPDTPCPNGSDLKLRIVAPAAVFATPDATEPTPIQDSAGYLDHLKVVEATGGLTVSDRATTTVSGRPATVLTLTPTQDFPGGLACEDASQALAKDCWGLVMGAQLRLAVIDVGAAPPVLMWMRGNPDNPEWAAAADQFDQMLTTVEFLKPLPAAS